MRRRGIRAGGRGGWRATVALLVALSSVPAVSAQSLTAGEYEVKAAYLVNFLLFVKPLAPESRTGRVERVIGILGDDPFGDSFKEVEGRTIVEDGWTLKVVRLGAYERSQDAALRTLDLLFIVSSERRKLPRILSALEGAPVVTVSELDGFTEVGGMFRLVLVGSRVRWEMNRAAVAAGGLTPSAQLCRTALRVHDGPGP